MITYNAKDLIEQAQMLADLQNSDFISWKENIMFLDNAWTDLYQQIINHGDKSFLQSFDFSGESCELPDDFYQLHYIYIDNGFNRIPVNRKAKTSTTEGPFYDIVGNEIVITSNRYGASNIHVDYYPVKDSITYAPEDINIPEIPGTILDVYGENVLYEVENEDGTKTRYVKNIIKNTEPEPLKLNSNFMISIDGEGPYKKGWYPINHFGYMKKDGRAYYMTNLPSKSISKLYGYGTINLKSLIGIPSDSVSALTSDGVYYIEDCKLHYADFDGNDIIYAENTTYANKVYSFNDDIYYATENGIYRNDTLIVSPDKYNFFNGVLKVDNKTGYGILVDNNRIISAFEDTELCFPSNVYFNVLAYKLAGYYKIKQNADPSGMAVLADSALKTFYDSLPRDTNGYVRIANAYAR